MLRYYLCLYLLFYLIQTYSQTTVIFKQGFESTGDNWAIENLSTPPCTNGDDTWNYHSELENIIPAEGGTFWGIKDLNGNCGSSGFEYLEFETIDISTLRDVQLSFEVQVIGFDNGDDMKYQLWFDGISQEEFVFIDGQNDFSTDSWLTVSMSVPNYINELKLRISVKQNGSDTAGIDNILLTGEAISPCEELMISEYVEGLSSSSHRNNYIELYNPTNKTVDLSLYKLLKFTGSNTEASELQLSGELAPFKTFLIEDQNEILGIEADLSTNNSVMDYNGDDKVALQKADKIIDLIGQIGASEVFAKNLCLRRKSLNQKPNNQFDLNEWDVYGLENTDNLNLHASQCEGDLPEIEVTGLAQIITDGSERTSLFNNTYFGSWPASKDTLITRSFTIRNSGTSNLNINDILISGESALRFSHSFDQAISILPKDSIDFQLFYTPSSTSLHTALIEILNNDPSENPFNFVIQGEGTGPTNHPLIISQYYEGNANNKWLEITNSADQRSPENSYYLALFRNSDTEQPIGLKPYRKVLIPPLEPNQTIKFCATLNVTEPEYALDGSEIKSAVCGFTGDDILIISTSGEESCWADRTDIVGRSGEWGSNLSLVRKYGCDAASSNSGFNRSNWIVYSIDEIDLASTGANEQLGHHNSGSTTWNQGLWSNGFPDINRQAIIADHYMTNMHGNIEACSVHILDNASLIINANKNVQIKKDLLVDGILEVENEGSLLMNEDSGLIENKGILRIHKTTTALNPLDYTYWSSPINNARLETVFEQSPQNSFFVFSTIDFEDLNNDNIDDNNDAWVGVSGEMEIGRGHTSMAPNTIPFLKHQKVIFEGTVNSGVIQIPISKQSQTLSEQRSWNFIGNPYPSALNAEALLNHPMNKDLLHGTFYFWTHTTEAATDGSLGDQHYTSSDYAMYTVGIGGVKAHENGESPTNFISSCQGFFVEAQKEGLLYVNNAMRVANDSATFFKPIRNENKQENKIWINLTDSKGAFSQLLIGFINEATAGYDEKFDGIRFLNDQNLNFYSMVAQHRLGIQGLPHFRGEETIPLGLISNISKSVRLQISIDHMTGIISDTRVILTDKLLGKAHDLTLGPYDFESTDSGPVDNRFALHFSDLQKEIVIPEVTKLKWNLMHNVLSVNTNKMDTIRQLEIFDLNGRKLRDINSNKTIVEVNSHGLPRRAIYILKVQLSDFRKFISKILM